MPYKKMKSSSHHISYKTEASFEYLNHTHDPAFAVHPCPSPIFCHQEDKSELRGATPHFLPRLSPKPAQEWLPANFTVHSDFSTTISAIRLLSPATSVIGGFLRRQSRVHCWLYLCHTGCTPIPLRLIPAPQASIAAPGSSVQLSANISAICVFVNGFRLPWIHH